jgi:hypothetical protein
MDRNALVIVENRPDVHASKILRAHKKHLPDSFKMVWYSMPNISNAASYNELLTSVTFWNSLIQYDRVMICQHDSGLLREGIEEFYEWSYVGAPWKHDAPWNPGKGGNGGLSLRDPRAALELCRTKKYHAKYGNEDVYFSRFLQNVAPVEVCEKFACETVYKLGTIGYHAIDKHLTPEQAHRILTQYD